MSQKQGPQHGSKKESPKQGEKGQKGGTIRGALGLGQGFDAMPGGLRSGLGLPGAGSPTGIPMTPAAGAGGAAGQPGHKLSKQDPSAVRKSQGGEGSRNLRAGVQRPQGDRGSGS